MKSQLHMGKNPKPEPSNNEPNQNPDFAKNRTKPYPVKNRTQIQMLWFLLFSFTE